jgi:hypothetical protein
MSAVPASAQDAEVTAMNDKKIFATRITDKSLTPRIDGVLDEVLWRQIEPTEGLHQIQPVEFAPATENTRFWVAYDDDNLYIAVQMHEQNPGLIDALQPIQGKPFESDDQMHISLDPFNKNRDGYFFQVNANGVRREALLSNNPNTGFNPDWEAIWDAASTINDEGWSTEISIPFKSISFNADNDTWGFNLGRVIRRKGEFLAWSSRGADVWEMGPTVMGDLAPITGVKQGLGLDVQLSGVINRNEDHVLNQNDTDAEPSLDIFYKPDPTFTLAATINTDFSATEVDDRIINLTRFDVLLPEKRDFFLQDANQFSFADLNGNGMPYFSRSIGLDENGRPVSLDGGIKVSGRFDNYTLGALAIRQEASGAQQKDADLYVLRATRNVLQESSLGIMYTNGDPRSDQDNEVFGVDFNYNNSNAFGNRLIQAFAWYQEVDTGADLDDNSAYGFTFAYPNSRYSLVWNFREIGRNFSPAMGFVNRKDIRQHNLNGGFRNYFTGGWIRSYNPTFEYEHVTKTNDVRQSEILTLTPLYFDSIAGDEISLSVIDQFEYLSEDFNVVDDLIVPAGEYNFERVNFRLGSSIARRFYASAEYENGNFFNGDRFDQIYTMGWRPWRPLLLTLEYEVAELDLPSDSYTTRLTRFGTELAITPDWSWLLFSQYDNVSDQIDINSRLRWLPEAGTEFYFVINKSKQRLDNDSLRSLYDDYVLKASYTFRF